MEKNHSVPSIDIISFKFKEIQFLCSKLVKNEEYLWLKALIPYERYVKKL